MCFFLQGFSTLQEDEDEPPLAHDWYLESIAPDNDLYSTTGPLFLEIGENVFLLQDFSGEKPHFIAVKAHHPLARVFVLDCKYCRISHSR